MSLLPPHLLMTLMQNEKAKALHDLLSWAHAEQYTGLDDPMADDYEQWIGNLTDDEVMQIALSTYKALPFPEL